MLFEFTKYGPQHLAGADYKSIMPAYKGQLSDQEIWQVLAYIKAQWPESIRKNTRPSQVMSIPITEIRSPVTGVIK